MAVKVLQTVAPNLKLTFPEGQKSSKEREKAAAKLSKGFQKLIRQVPQNELTVDKYKQMVYSLIPSIKPPIDVVQVEQNGFLGACQTTVSVKEEQFLFRLLHKGYRVKLNLDVDKILSDKDIVVHETRHLFDNICSPKKVIQRNLGYASDIEFADKITDTMADIRHPEIPLTKKRLNDKLSNFDTEVTVGILQQVGILL